MLKALSRSSLRTALATVLSCVLVGAVLAETPNERLSQSVEGLVSGAPESYTEQLDEAPLLQAEPLVQTGARGAVAGRSEIAAHPGGRVFSIFDAQAVMSWDDDYDGFFHRLRVSFDPDVTGDEAWVYARLYLSLEGGPWNHIHTTEVFPVRSDDSDDAYEVVTRLIDGYPTGYYDVLIELYDADYDLLVLNYGPYEDRDLAALPLEDSYRDSYDDHDGGGGAVDIGLLLWLMAGGLLLRRALVAREAPAS
jgi:hypothetical protein